MEEEEEVILKRLEEIMSFCNYVCLLLTWLLIYRALTVIGVCVCVYICVHVFMHTYMCVHVYVCGCMYMYIHVCACVPV